MSEISRFEPFSPGLTKRKLLDSLHLNANAGISDSPVDFDNLDTKTRQMLDMLINEDFKRKRTASKMHLKLATWVFRNKIQHQIKRVFDIIFALISLIPFTPILVLTSVAIKVDSPGPVIFKQLRVGKSGEQFYCFKFRSMVMDADQKKSELMERNEADEIVFKIRNDPRITRVGRIIRKLSIDEMPQIFNVLRGDMSIVGPRPPVPVEVENYEYEHFYRLDVVPGITGLQQVSGRSDVNFKRWVELDLEYIHEQSLWKDIQIILLTIPAVISGKGAY